MYLLISLVVFIKLNDYVEKLCSYTEFSIYSSPVIKTLLRLHFHKLCFLFPRKIQMKNSIILTCISSFSEFNHLKLHIYTSLDCMCKCKNSLFVSFFSFFVSFFFDLLSYFTKFNGKPKYQTSLLLLLYQAQYGVLGYHS